MKLIVGLGNPGREYVNTRHNIGYDLLDYISLKKGYQINKNKFNSLYCETMINNEKVIIIKPETFMNSSGEAVSKFVSYYHIDPSNILVIQDDLDMHLGRVKIVSNSSAGGHNGIKNIESLLNTSSFVRVKIGIGRDKEDSVRNYVLSSFNIDESNVIKKVYEDLVNIIEDFCTMSLTMLQSKYNKK